MKDETLRREEWHASEGQIRERAVFGPRFPEYRTTAVAEQEPEPTQAARKQKKTRRARRAGSRAKRAAARARDSENTAAQPPQKLAEWGNSYGKISAGLDEHQNFVMVATKQRNQGLKTPPQDSRRINADNMDGLKGQPGTFSVNQGPGEEHSAVAYQEDKNKSAPFMAGRIRGMMRVQDHLELPQAVMPFMNDCEQRAELAALREQAHQSGPGGERTAQNQSRRRMEYLQAELTRKEQLQRDFMQKLAQAIAATRTDGRESTPDDGGFLAFLSRLLGGDDAGATEGEDENNEEEEG
ncbi:MAG: hypothetical protein Q4B48_01035 [Syntrophomonadaceae bacterium]|nr:hypothetical protein [Syntrophomonadaceae bacterium]